MASNIIEQTRALHEDTERLENVAVQFLLEEPKTVSKIYFAGTFQKT